MPSMPSVTYNGQVYKVNSRTIEIPDLDAMPAVDAKRWLLNNTYPKGYSKSNPLAGLGGEIQVSAYVVEENDDA